MSHGYPRRVIAYHVIMTYYGFWLPNDPRGSGSHAVWAPNLKPFGPATHTDSRKSVARVPHDIVIRKLAKEHLKYPPVVLNGEQALCVGEGFGAHIRAKGLVCHAAAIMPEHVHLVLTRTAEPMEDVMTDLKGAAVKRLLECGVHPFQTYRGRGEKLPKLWARSGRKIFCFDDDDILARIDYVERNPDFAKLPRQTWSFVTPFGV